MSVSVISWVLKNSEETLGRRLVLLVLADKADDDGSNVWPSIATIAAQARLSERQVRRCLRRLEDSKAIERVGASKKGTNLYRVLMGADNMSPPPVVGGDISGTEEMHEMSPDPSLEQPSIVTTTDVVVTEGNGRKSAGWKVDRRMVTTSESSLARQVLVEWNQQTGQILQSRDWLAKIIMRIREHPDLTIEDHAFVIHRALENPWWKGPASPSVVYGNGAQFERSIVAAQKDADPRGKVLTSADIRAMADEAERRGL